MRIFTISFLSVLFSMMILDGLWLGFMYKRLYAPQLEHLIAPQMNFVAAIFFYLIFTLALTVLVVQPAVQNQDALFKVLIFGMLFDLATYGTYDLTNQVTLKGWPWMITVVDIAWGTFLTGAVTLIATLASRYIP
jgi:uncharacterized membrane protein